MSVQPRYTLRTDVPYYEIAELLEGIVGMEKPFTMLGPPELHPSALVVDSPGKKNLSEILDDKTSKRFQVEPLGPNELVIYGSAITKKVMRELEETLRSNYFR